MRTKDDTEHLPSLTDIDAQLVVAADLVRRADAVNATDTARDARKRIDDLLEQRVVVAALSR